ncbi:hypothetical protein Goari_003566 [Gossypium aridum]|nr:hypothetical protein [Gossypium aridum]
MKNMNVSYWEPPPTEWMNSMWLVLF